MKKKKKWNSLGQVPPVHASDAANVSSVTTLTANSCFMCQKENGAQSLRPSSGERLIESNARRGKGNKRRNRARIFFFPLQEKYAEHVTDSTFLCGLSAELPRSPVSFRSFRPPRSVLFIFLREVDDRRIAPARGRARGGVANLKIFAASFLFNTPTVLRGTCTP